MARRTLFSILAVLLIGGAGCDGDPAPQEQARSAPDFSRATHTGETFTLSDHRGSVVVVNFWATWCAPCRKEIPEFVALQDEYGDSGLQFVGVSLDQKGFDVVRPFAERMDINYPLVMATADMIEAYGGVRAIPTTFIVGKKGRIQKKIRGLTTRGQLMRTLDDMLTSSGN